VSRLVVIGDALLDRDVDGVSERLAPDAPVPVLEQGKATLRPGGAALAAVLAARGGRPVTLVAALAADAAGSELARALLARGVDLVALRLIGSTPEKIRLLERGRPLLRLDRGGGGEIEAGGTEPALAAALAEAGAILVSDYGRGVAAAAEVRQALAHRPAGIPLVWDPHPRGPVPVAGAELATPNLEEALALVGAAPGPAPGPPAGIDASPAALARALAVRWRAGAVCVTRGENGATLADAAGEPTEFEVRSADGDPCGAGDAFAAAAAWALADGAEVADAVAGAGEAAAAFVAGSGARGIAAEPAGAGAVGSRSEPGAAAPGAGDTAAALALAERVRAEGGTVVATGGCFDLLHLGHVRSLEAARGFGDCLIVLLNGDRSVRALKGADRPLIGQADRAGMLAAMSCVDAVAIFDESEPSEALSVLRPDVWAKGGDYQLDELAEAKAIATWGGRIAILPYLEERSTTRLIKEVGEHVGS
jgi:rfaE bifunctional protein nucleotidyltransferase chain/domain/rfaE bifunctional protein kinase chain/domain